MTRPKPVLPPEPAEEPIAYQKRWPRAVYTIADDMKRACERCEPIVVSIIHGRVEVRSVGYNRLAALVMELEQAVKRDRKRKRVGDGGKK